MPGIIIYVAVGVSALITIAYLIGTAIVWKGCNDLNERIKKGY